MSRKITEKTNETTSAIQIVINRYQEQKLTRGRGEEGVNRKMRSTVYGCRQCWKRGVWGWKLRGDVASYTEAHFR